MKKLLTLSILIFSYFQVNAQLCGTYTIDASKPTKKTNFNTISEAVSALTFQNLDCDVVFEIAPGTYSEPIVVEGVQSELSRNVLFTNNGTESVSLMTDGLAILISNSKNITISNINFTAISTEMSSMVVLSNSNNVTIESNNFKVTDINGKHKSVFSLTNTSNDNIIRMNSIKGASGFDISRLSNNNLISSNDISFANTGISIGSSLESKIECNSLKGILTDYKKGIVVDGYVGNITITSNAILGVNEGISQLITYRPSENKLTGNIVNNLIESKGNTVNLSNNVKDLQIAFNTFTSKTGSVIYFTEEIKESVSKITLFANNLLNWTDAPIVYVANPYLLDKTDYNNIYNENGSFYTKVGQIESKSLSAWKASMNAKNAISVDPMFVSFGAESYRLAENSPCIDAGPNAYDIGTISNTEKESDLAKVPHVGAKAFDKENFEELVYKFEFAQKQ